ncbi:MAG: hypothetical protein A3E36_02175 [Candidatus Andersenbacteria bacterium RIFCSPHIGHO2_12_FULL_45_11b]|uniref:Uncharacterized protein n=1 Tax=Candidatus Andersenbacteria bacterium RIFCSPHIGHO2_12_FULL_45_11b TaxID=1797282 RepID=A0A1G1XD13_9BACT|nr:MAG: hypothetical protein A3E36_02175 [Candidatus Andersenbacteria bacterium RIFCSPHIGHO2_12_FULL_45_11b]
MNQIRLGQTLDLDEENHKKFLITREGEDFVFHCGATYSHADLAARLELDQENIMGGGEMDVFCDGTLVLKDDSMKYGGVPKEVLEPLVPELLRVTKATTAVVNPQFHGQMEKWK